jgi:hypothetical protein
VEDQVNATPEPKRVPWNKGKLTGGEATAATQARLVDSDEAPDRRPHSITLSAHGTADGRLFRGSRPRYCSN